MSERLTCAEDYRSSPPRASSFRKKADAQIPRLGDLTEPNCGQWPELDTPKRLLNAGDGVLVDQRSKGLMALAHLKDLIDTELVRSRAIGIHVEVQVGDDARSALNCFVGPLGPWRRERLRSDQDLYGQGSRWPPEVLRAGR